MTGKSASWKLAQDYIDVANAAVTQLKARGDFEDVDLPQAGEPLGPFPGEPDSPEDGKTYWGAQWALPFGYLELRVTEEVKPQACFYLSYQALVRISPGVFRVEARRKAHAYSTLMTQTFLFRDLLRTWHSHQRATESR